MDKSKLVKYESEMTHNLPGVIAVTLHYANLKLSLSPKTIYTDCMIISRQCSNIKLKRMTFGRMKKKNERKRGSILG